MRIKIKNKILNYLIHQQKINKKQMKTNFHLKKLKLPKQHIILLVTILTIITNKFKCNNEKFQEDQPDETLSDLETYL